MFQKMVIYSNDLHILYLGQFSPKYSEIYMPILTSHRLHIRIMFKKCLYFLVFNSLL